MSNELKTNYVVVDLNNNDPKERVWVSFATKDQAEAWIKNFNDNARRKRNFGIEEKEVQ